MTIDHGIAQKLSRSASRVIIGCSLFLIVVTTTVFAYYTAFSRLHPFDDEGFMMLTLSGFFSGATLYTDVASPYGPIYYYWLAVVHNLGSWPITHDSLREVVILHWFSACLMLALAAFANTRSLALATLVFVQSVLHLEGLTDEPGHPQQLIVVLIAFAALAAASMPREFCMIALGLIGVGLVFTKINVGAFYCLSLVLLMATQSTGSRQGQMLTLGLSLLCAAIPLWVMKDLMHETWVASFGFGVFSSLIAAVLTILRFGGEKQVGFREWLTLISGIAAALLSVLTMLLIKGVTTASLVESLVTVPSTVPVRFCIPFVAPHNVAAGACALFTCILVMKFWPRLVVFWAPIAVLKGVLGCWGITWLERDYAYQIGYLVPWSWLIMVPTPGLPLAGRQRWFRAFLCVTLALQTAQSYPVAGTQNAIGSFLGVIVFSLCLYDVARYFQSEHGLKRILHRLPYLYLLSKPLVFAVIALTTILNWCPGIERWSEYLAASPAELYGCDRIRAPAQQVARCRQLAQFIGTNCRVVFVFPTLNSLHFWCNTKPLNYCGVAEVALFSDAQEKAIIEALRRREGAAVVVNNDGLRMLHKEVADVLGDGALNRFFRRECVKEREIAGCTVFRVSRRFPETINGSDGYSLEGAQLEKVTARKIGR